MSQFSPPPGIRGAIDLSALRTPAPGAGTAGPGSLGTAAGAPGAAATGAAGTSTGTTPGLPEGLVLDVTDGNIGALLERSLQVPLVLVLWSAQHASTREGLDQVARAAATLAGRVLVLSAELGANPAVAQAFQPLLTQVFGQMAIPASIGFVQGQPMPMFAGIQPEEQVTLVLDKLLEAAVANGVTGRVELGAVRGGEVEEGAAEAADGEAEEELPPLHQEAYDAIDRGDLAAARAAYEAAVAADPKDSDAKLGLAQVGLMERTEGADLAAARAAAADNPADVDAQTKVADLDLLGGHVEDAFLRLIDTVRATSGEDRDRARAHLLELFDVVGGQDERVRKARTALMNALY